MTRSPRHAEIIRNRRFAVLMVLALVVLAASWLLRPERTGRLSSATQVGPGPEGTGAATGPPSVVSSGSSASSTGGGSAATPAGRVPSERTGLRLVLRRTEAVSPVAVAVGHDVVAVPTSSGGHDVVLFRANGSVIGRVSDAVELARYRISGHEGVVRGSPAGAAVVPDGRYVYVTNASMSGGGFGSGSSSSCAPAASAQPSYVYRLELATLSVDQVIPVGVGPGPIAMTPDGKYLLVGNSCSSDLTVVSTERAAGVATVQLDGPAGAVVVSPDGRVGYATVPRRDAIVAVDLATVVGGVAQAQTLATVAGGPTALAVSPDGRHLYTATKTGGPGGTSGSGGMVSRLDASGGVVLARAATRTPRANALLVSADGTALFVAADGPASVTKLAAADLRGRAQIPTPTGPVGLAYDPAASRLWVACRSGSVLVVDDTAPRVSAVLPAT